MHGTEDPFVLRGRSVDELTGQEALAAAQPTPLSFSAMFLDRMCREEWTLDVERWDLDTAGRGVVVYRCMALEREFRMLIFSDRLEEADREDRSIANRWDGLGFLVEGTLDDARIRALRVESSRGGRDWRVDPLVYCWSKVNRSSRVFDHVVDALAEGMQPDLARVREAGYLFRNSGVIANGAQGTIPYAQYREDSGELHPLGEPFAAQMLALYIWREFSFDLVDFLAESEAPAFASRLADEVRAEIGVGNSSSLGLVLFVVNNPELIHSWRLRGEVALGEALEGEFDVEDLIRLGDAVSERITRSEFSDDAQMHAEFDEVSRGLLEGAHPVGGGDVWNTIAARCSRNLQELFVAGILETRTYDPHLELAYCDALDVGDIDGAIGSMSLEDVLAGIDRELAREELHHGAGRTRLSRYYRSVSNREPRITTDVTRLQARREAVPADVFARMREVARRLRELPAQDRQQGTRAFITEIANLWWVSRHLVLSQEYPLGMIRSELGAEGTLPSTSIRLGMALMGLERLEASGDHHDVTGVALRGALSVRRSPRAAMNADARLHTSEEMRITTREVASTLRRAIQAAGATEDEQWVGAAVLQSRLRRAGGLRDSMLGSWFIERKVSRSPWGLSPEFRSDIGRVLTAGLAAEHRNSSSGKDPLLAVSAAEWRRLVSIADSALVGEEELSSNGE